MRFDMVEMNVAAAVVAVGTFRIRYVFFVFSFILFLFLFSLYRCLSCALFSLLRIWNIALCLLFFFPCESLLNFVPSYLLVECVEQVFVDRRALLAQVIKLKLVKRKTHSKNFQAQKSINCFDLLKYWISYGKLHSHQQQQQKQRQWKTTTAKALITTQPKSCYFYTLQQFILNESKIHVFNRKKKRHQKLALSKLLRNKLGS